MPRASKALERFTVLDLTRVRSGPTCVRQLADWGANVIKIELPAHLDADEGMGGPRHGSDFQNLHRNKRAMTLDLKSPEGIAVLKRLVETADVIVENFRPDVKTRLGIGYKQLAKINPRLVYASISGFGQDGPYSGRPGFDQIAQGMGGLMSITGEPERGPMRVGIPIADLSAGLFAAMGILTALLEREVSGKGQEVQTSLLQAQVFMLDFQGARYLNEGEIPGQAGNNHPTSIPTGVFKCKDGFINIAASGQAIWERFARAVGGEVWLIQAAFKTGKDRSKNRDALNAEIEKKMRTKTVAAWVDQLNTAGVPCGPINDMKGVFDDVQVKHLKLADSVDAKDSRGQVKVIAQPVSLSRTPSRIVSAPPERGEHTDAILREHGFSKGEIAALRKNAVI